MSFYDLLLSKKLSGGGGVTPTGTIEITENGTYDVSSYASANVEVGGADFVINDVSALFYDGARVDELEKYLKAISKNPTGASYMFHQCTTLTDLDLSDLNTSNFTNMMYMFTGCTSLENINFSNWNTSNVTNMGYLFSRCEKLTSIDMSNFDLSNVTGIYNMFNNCGSLQTLSLGTKDTDFSKITSSSSVFYNCRKLESVTINGINVLPITNSNSFTNLKSDCKFYVPANLVDSYKSATNWSTRASYIYAIS